MDTSVKWQAESAFPLAESSVVQSFYKADASDASSVVFKFEN